MSRLGQACAIDALYAVDPLHALEPTLADVAAHHVDLSPALDQPGDRAAAPQQAGEQQLSDALRRLAEEEPLASVALLTPSPEASDEYFSGLSGGDLPRLRRVENQEFSFTPGIEVTEIEQVKGLEFDYVIVVDASAEQFPDSSLARRRLNVAATRAIHQLWVTCVGTPSPLVASLGGASG